MLQTLPFLLLLSIILGGVIGLGRENKNQGGEVGGAAGGIRTFALICLLGALSGVFYVEYFPVFVFITSLLSLFLVSYYILGSLATKHVGLTNEISILYTFLIGFLLTTDLLSMQLVIALFVVFILILAFKEESKKIIGGISRAELQSFISYAI
ncbi:MAG: MgtC/SapB family protein, partial [Candidatus Magasanikbacteria bacterium]|nr:MgtC/SapB family protein [Candidatus Magasanikbacteria bacterium]